MIGVYNYSVIVTYLGVVLAFSGMILSFNGYFEYAILCLSLAGACDTFDGKIARAMKNRTEEMIIYGVQIDSLCDMICFGVTPAIMAYQMGLQTPWGIAIEILFVLCGAIRLAYFNVLEELKKKEPPTDAPKYFHGLPITTITIIFPVVFLFHPYVTHEVFSLILAISLLITAFFYIFDIKIKKPGNGGIAVMMVFVTLVMFRVLHIF
ncbi:MAG TPA: CDP-diacylglycerol--serine O-phosphatidyltransferase [Lachnospiraceae bacterium]|nr:CDP-alcohol phosphatidyltransferase family protein [Eubacterium sp.]HAK57998.1 CDP-diacylglycerol--serine O-phosphatidyltransferase [Lachnospiraceae bacterium]